MTDTPDMSLLLEPRSRAGKRLSLIVPMHNEQEALPVFFPRVVGAIENLGVAFEIVCVDDGSRDATLPMLVAEARKDPRLKVVTLARNFGKESALTAGIDVAEGDMIVPIDADLQDPPELIAEFLDRWEQGYDVVYGVRGDRQSDGFLKRRTASLFYDLFNWVSPMAIPHNTGDFRLMDRSVVETLKQLPERNRFMKGLFAWVGYRQIGVTYVRPKRSAGSTSWRYDRLFHFAVDGITSFSTLPLRVWTVVGLGTAGGALLWAGAIIARTLILGRDVPGYASLMVVLLFGLAMQMIAFGVLGEYVGRLYQEAKGRPIYVIRRLYAAAAPQEAPSSLPVAHSERAQALGRL
jgi:polyisoprenyl-phosphate glycosyltransferase